MTLSQDKKLEIVNAELDLCQRQMDKYDALLRQVRGWAITLWIASLGWSFQVERKEVVLLGIVVFVVFWILDGSDKTYREGYKARRNTVTEAIRAFFDTEMFPKDFSSPNFPRHENHFGGTVKNMFRAHVGMLYAVLLAVSIIFYMAV